MQSRIQIVGNLYRRRQENQNIDDNIGASIFIITFS